MSLNKNVLRGILIIAFLTGLNLSGARPVSAQAVGEVSISGWFTILWGDNFTGATSEPLYQLTDESGQATQLLLDETVAQSQGGVLSLNRKYISVQGIWAAPLSIQAAQEVLNVTSISLVAAPGTEAPNGDVLPLVSGSKPWISIMCKFSDYAVEPNNLAFFQGMYSSAYPGLDHYWREQSYGTANIAGSTASGWYVLPHTEAYYNPSDTAGGTDLDLLRSDCIATADANVDFSPYSGINMMFNANFDNGWAWGGSDYLTLDGITKFWSLTWEPPWGYAAISVIAHEMGHGFGLPHSSGAYGQTYDNQWDVMSDTWSNCSRLTDPTYGCLGQHTISYHKDILGWIPTGQKYIVGTGSSVTLNLEQLALPATGNYKMAQIPISGSSTHFYSVEARRQTGYDYKLPGQSVIIHEVDTTRTRPAYVIDTDGNGNTGDAGAMWTVGEIFSDATNKVFVSVLSATSSGFQVNIQNNYSLVTISGNAGIAGATLSYTDGTPKTATADGSGNYSFTVSYNWSGTVTPSKAGFTFSPANRTYSNVLTNQAGQNYTAIPITYTISGNVGMAGATLSYTDGASKTVISAADGSYSFPVSYNWSGTITPTRSCYTYNPLSRSYSNITANQTAQNYTFTITPGCFPGAGIYDDIDVGWSYTGSWTAYTGSGPYNNTLHYTSTTGNAASFTFSGTQFLLTYTQSSARGTIDVFVDGSKVSSINANGAVQWKKMYVSPIFPAGTHVAQFRHAGGSFIDVDAIQILAAAAPGAGGYDDTNPNWSYTGSWTAYTGSGPYNNTLHYTSTLGDTASFTFSGTQFVLTYTQSSARGTIDVYVDGSKVSSINANGITQWQKTFTSPVFPAGTHVAQFRHAGGSFIDVDAIQILVAATPGAGGYDDTNPNWFYTGSWTAYTGSGPYNNTLHYTSTLGDTASFTFSGTQFMLTYTQSAARGTIDVYVDGTKRDTINANGATQWQKTYTSPVFPAGTHVAQFRHAGGSFIDVDAIQILANPYDDTDINWTYTGSWTAYTGSGPYNNTLHYTSTVGNAASFTFSGTQFILTYTQSAARGTIDVYVDGTKRDTINANGATLWQKTYTSPVFPAGTHIAQFRNAGGLFIDVDAIQTLP